MARLLGLSSELQKWRDVIREKAVQGGLDFFEVIFEMVEPQEINEIAALGGFPQRYPHWRFGMEYERLSKSYTYGLSKIYELVINTDPCYAYLLSSNSLTDQKLVMAHVYGHSDFFKNNKSFDYTNRRMLDWMANAAVKVRRFQELHGVDKVESFMDQCLSLDNLINYHTGPQRKEQKIESKEDKAEELPQATLTTRSYLTKFVKPQAEVNAKKQSEEGDVPPPKKFPEHPEKDVLWFLLKHAPLDDWQRECLNIVREEAYYFAPQGQTKIMNEGWASYWHATLLTQGGIINDSEILHYADVHSGTMYTPPGGMNPYKIGLELYRDIEERWNKGQFGKEWDECDDVKAKQNWDKKLGLGKQKIYEVRKLYNDVTFIDTFLTEDFCKRNNFFTFSYNARNERDEIESRDFKKVKSQILSQLTNFGQPVIELIEANHENRGELLLLHRHSGQDLRPDYVELTLKNLHAIWRRPVLVETLVEGKKKHLRFDGKEYSEKSF